ncbi:hypothetical protein PABY_21360 [Pyrodictium abyssi]|uniref:Cation/H+ exchanger domain-containing protein n=1 Tax=Pyrodictium abyssi TaxID=54256 RepID=A0ABN6ZQU7_9CREN|nr:hypothetical protein PABY_21360 [Pyrodictium abyssi]
MVVHPACTGSRLLEEGGPGPGSPGEALGCSPGVCAPDHVEARTSYSVCLGAPGLQVCLSTGAKRAVLLVLVAVGAIFISFLASKYMGAPVFIDPILVALKLGIEIEVSSKVCGTSSPGRAPGRLGLSAHSPGGSGSHPGPGLGREHVEVPGRVAPSIIRPHFS